MTVLSIGEPLVELNAASDSELSAATEFTVGFGGDSSNFAIAAKRSGARASYLTRIGDDGFGRMLRELWSREGVDTEHVLLEPGGRTGIYFIARGRHRSSFTYYRDASPASRLSPADIPERAVAEASVVHITGITQAISPSACDAAFHAIGLARRHGTLVSYDPNHRPVLWPVERARAIVMRSVELADIVVPNLEEGRVLTGREEPEDVLAAFAERGPGIVALTLGERGALLSVDGRMERIPAIAVRPVDPSGAGDTFGGAFVARLLAGDEPGVAAGYATAAAGLSTTGSGAVSPIPTADAVRARVRQDQSAG